MKKTKRKDKVNLHNDFIDQKTKEYIRRGYTAEEALDKAIIAYDINFSIFM